MAVRAYTRCAFENVWFAGTVCPNDGSASEWSVEVDALVKKLGTKPLSIETLVGVGLPPTARAHVLVIDQQLETWPPEQPIIVWETD